MKYLLLSFVLFSCTDILSKNSPKELFAVQIGLQEDTLKVMYYSSDATIQSSIQVQKIIGDSVSIVNRYDRYNYMDTCQLLNDSTFLLVLRDTISVLGNKPDTMIITL